MPRVVGIDPGTKSFDLCGLEDGRVFLDETRSTIEVSETPSSVAAVVERAEPLDLVVGPSGMGLPLKKIEELNETDLFQMTLVRPDDEGLPVIIGLGKFVKELRRRGTRVVFIPGVIHLDTVPEYRKVNKIDMGTADKLCCAALGVFDQAKTYSIGYSETSFILVEMGFGYNAVIGVEGGKIVDGIGGTTAGPGFLTLGAMDGELAYVLGKFSKELLFRGGVTSIIGRPNIMPEDFYVLTAKDAKARMAWEAFHEGLVKSVAGIKSVVESPKEIILSGRLSRVKEIGDEAARRLSKFGKVRRIGQITSKAKEAAQGAAIIADGLAGGKMKALVEAIGIRNCSGNLLEHIYVENLVERYKLA